VRVKKYVRDNDSSFKEEYPQKFIEEQIAFAFEPKKKEITYKMIECKTRVSITIQKRRFKNSC